MEPQKLSDHRIDLVVAEVIAPVRDHDAGRVAETIGDELARCRENRAAARGQLALEEFAKPTRSEVT